MKCKYLRYAGSPDTGGGGSDRDGEELSDGGVHVVHLRYEDGGDGLIERSAVHVDGGADGKDEPDTAHIIHSRQHTSHIILLTCTPGGPLCFCSPAARW